MVFAVVGTHSRVILGYSFFQLKRMDLMLAILPLPQNTTALAFINVRSALCRF